MTMIFSMIIGCVSFAVISFCLGQWLRSHPTRKAARVSTRFIHSLFIITVLVPTTTGMIELARLDECAGVPSLSLGTISGILGALMLLSGIALMSVSLVVLLDGGQGLPLFELSRRVAMQSLYRYSRNPMSLGFYLICIGAGILGESSFFTFWSLLVLIPAHVVFLKYFEEYELDLRLGQAYRKYKETVPFLIPKWPIGNSSLKRN